MPKNAATRLPPDVGGAAVALGINPARVAVLHALTAHPDSTPAELAQAAGMSVSTVRTHLGQLIDLDMVRSNPDAALPFSERNGQRARYAVRSDRLAADFQTLAAAFGLS